MKQIVKGGEPASLREWRLKSRSAPQNMSYKDIDSAPLAELRTTLLREQGYLCAYTMMRLKDESRGHIEHIEAQSVKREKSVDYGNVVYCHPGAGVPRCPFGAHAKDHMAVSRQDFVSPLDSNCEERFVYLRTGEIGPRDVKDRAASKTINDILKLNHPDLVSQRKAAIDNLPIFRRSAERLSAAEATKQAAALEQTDSGGRFRPFSPTLCQFLTRYAEQRAAQEKALQGASRPTPRSRNP